MALTRLDNLYSSKTGRYLYVSPDDFNATDELDNRGNSPLRPFKTIQRAFIEVARYSYLPGKNNDRFDQFSIMLMPGNHYIDNRPGLLTLGASAAEDRGRFFDAANLISNNKALIAREAVFRLLADPTLGTLSGFSIPGGNQNCIDDIENVLDEIIYNLKFGGNDRVWDAANLYVTGAHVEGEENQSVFAFEQARDLAIQVMRNELITIQGNHGLTQYVDNTITVDIQEPLCENVAQTLTTLFGIITTAIGTTGSPGSLNGITKTSPTNTEELPLFNFNQALQEWNDNSILDLGNPDNVLYKFNATSGGAIVPRGCSLVGYDLRRTIVRPLYVPDPVDGAQERTSIFNLTGGCYLWQFTIKDGDLSANSPLFDSVANVGKVYFQKGNTETLAIPEYSHHKICIMTYADNDELDLYYEKVGKSFSKYQPAIDDGDLEALVQENRIVGPLSDTRSIESIKPINAAGKLIVQVTTKIDHGYFEGQYVAILNSGLADDINGTFKITKIDQTNPRVFEYEIPEKVAAAFNLTDNELYTIANGLNTNAVAQAEIDSVESASPYVFNCSIRSTWGLCGMWADGSKATGFKSMVVAQYTGVSLQKDDRAFIRYDKFSNTWNQASLRDAFATVPYHTKGDAYWKDDWRNFHIRASDDAFIQCVSVFAVGFFDHFLMESGGDMSITNSNSNFGNTSLHAVGFKGFSFNQDKGGYVTDIIPPKEITGGYSDDAALDSFNSEKISYYPFDVKACNDTSNHNKLYISSDNASNPNIRPAATLNGYRIGARSDERIFVKLEPLTNGGTNKYYSTLEPSGFKTYTVSLETLNPSGVELNGKAQDSANLIEANRALIQDEAYNYIITKYPALLENLNIDITKCRRDIGYFVDAVVSDLRLDSNVNTIQAAEAYYIGNELAYIVGEKNETIETLDYVKNLCIAAMRNFDVLIRNCTTTANSAIVNVGSTVGLVVGMGVAEYATFNFQDNKLITGASPITTNIRANTFIKRIIDDQTIELGAPGSYLNVGNTRPAQLPSTSAFLYFTFNSAVWSDVVPQTFPDIVQDTEYPECNDIASTITSYFDNVKTIINIGLENNGVIKQESALQTSQLASRATLFTVNGSNPHNLETGTPVRLVPKAKAGTNPDKRVIRLPKEFDTNTRYYIIAPGRATYPEDYADTNTFGSIFDGSDQTKFMLARSRENACAGIYIYSPETDSIDSDVEIEIQQYLLDDNYSLHKYKCNMNGTSVIETDVSHVFDLPVSGITPQKVFFRVAEDILGSELPEISGQGTINSQTYFYPRYVTAKTFTIHRSFADAIAGVNAITFLPDSGKDFYVFADKRRSPLRFDATYQSTEEQNTSGLWYLNVLDESSVSNVRTDSILYRLHRPDYDDDSGKIRTNDTWYERVVDNRGKEDRAYRLRYVIPSYLETVRDPLNGFVLKVRTDDKRRLKPQKIVLKPIGGAVSVARFFNPLNPEEQLGLGIEEYNITPTYDPYFPQGVKLISSEKTSSKIAFSIQSAKKVTESNVDYLEIVAFDHTITNSALKNETFTVLKVTSPQGGIFDNDTEITWSGNSSGIATLHGYYAVGNTYHIIIKNIVSGNIQYDPRVNTRFQQGSTFVDLLAKPDSTGDSQGRSKSDRKDYLYRVAGANVYTLVPGDIITDDTDAQYVIDSVEDVGDIEDTFYIFDIDEIQQRIPNQQDGIYYLTCVRGNISPFPTGAGVGNNFRNFKFSQPISQLYPQNYKNDPFWYKQLDWYTQQELDPNDSPATSSAADNYIHGLVTVNDAKFNETKEVVLDLIKNPALNSFDYTNTSSINNELLDNRIRAQEGNATSGSEDRRIPISGDSEYPLDGKLYVELRRPSIARSGNHTFEYLGFGPGNYSTGFPLRQEVILEDVQDFYAQAKREDGGIVFYTGLNSNGDLYIGNRKINAITGEETFLEQAALIDAGGDDDGDTTGGLVTTFDVPVTFNERITVNGPSTFTQPIEVNVDGAFGLPIRVYSKLTEFEDSTLNRGSYTPSEKGDITIGKNRVQAAVFGITARTTLGLEGQYYSIRTNYLNGTPSNVTPNSDPSVYSQQDTSTNKLSTAQTVSFGGTPPSSGDIILKGNQVDKSGSLGWIFANSYTTVSTNIRQVELDGTNLVKIVINPSVVNSELGITSTSQIRIRNFSSVFVLNGIWSIDATDFDPGASEFYINVAGIREASIIPWEAQAVLEVGNSKWKEVGVIGSESIRTTTDIIGDYKVGINTVARSAHDALQNAFVSDETNPRANLDVVGTAFISGKKANNYRLESGTIKTETDQDNAFLVGGNSATPNNNATLRVATTNSGRVGINVNNSSLDRTFVVGGNGRITGDFKFESDIEVNGGDITTTNTAFNFVNQNTLQNFSAAANARNISLFNTTTDAQTINVGTASLETTLNIHTGSENSVVNIGVVDNADNTNESNITIGGAYLNPSQSIFRVRNYRTIFDGRLTLRGGFIEIDESTTSFTMFPEGLNELRIGGSTGIVEIGGVAGFTTIRHGLKVLGSTILESDVTQNGGFRNSSVGIDRNIFGRIVISQVTRSFINNIAELATIVTTQPHQLTTGDLVTIRCTDISFNTATPVSVTVVNATTFTYTSLGPITSATPASGVVIKDIGADHATGSLQNLNIDYYSVIKDIAEVLAIDAVSSNKLLVTGHYFSNNDEVKFVDVGNLAGVSTGITYFVRSSDSSGFTLSSTINGSELTISLQFGATDTGSARIVLNSTKIDTTGDDNWGGAEFDNGDNTYTLPVNNPSNITANQLLLIGTEIVRVVTDPTTTRPFSVNVLRAQDGTVAVSHPDGQQIIRLLKQENASYVFPNPVTAASTTLNIGELSAFLRVDDIFRINKGTSSDEFVRISQIDASDAQSFKITNGDFGTIVDPKDPLEMFKVISTTGNTQIIGDVIIGYDVNQTDENPLNTEALRDAFGTTSSTATGATIATSGGGNLKVHNSIELSGNTDTTTPSKQYFVITNGSSPRLYVESASGNTRLYNGANLTVFKDSFFTSGSFDKSRTDIASNVAFRVLGSTGNTQIAGTLRTGDDLTVGTLQIPENAESVSNVFTTRFSVDAQTGSTFVGRYLTIDGLSSANPVESEVFLQINNLGENGNSDFKIKQDRSIDSFGETNFYNINGGRKTIFISTQGNTDATAVNLRPNLQYIVRPTSTLVLRLPENAVTGDIVRIVDAGGALNFSNSLVVRAPANVQIQSTLGGSTLGGLGSNYGSGELVVNTPNAAFGLIYVGDTDGDGNGIPGEQQGWFLMEI